MAYTGEDLIQIVADRRESLGTEIKQWISPATDEGIAKIAKACIALRNNDGGCLIIGFTDDGSPDIAHRPANVRAVFTQDVIQGIVSRYSSHPFEVTIEFIEFDGVEYPVICVDNGIRQPIAAKSDLCVGTARLIKADTLYVRSLHTNGTVSTAEAKAKDWEAIIAKCFENREADIGSFLRRHLPRLTDALHRAEDAPAEPRQLAAEFLNTGFNRFIERWNRSGDPLPEIGLREAAFVIVGQVPPFDTTRRFLDQLFATKPRHTGWSPFIDSSRRFDDGFAANVVGEGWEALISTGAESVWGKKLDFWRAEPSGRFYCLRGIEDDQRNFQGQDLTGREIDYRLQIGRIAEVISIGLAFARAMGCDEETSSVAFAFRWTRLRGRHLSCWADREHFSYWSVQPSEDDNCTATTNVPLVTPQSGINEYVNEVASVLFRKFGGEEFSARTIERVATETLNRQM